MGNLSCFSNGPDLSFAERRRARSRFGSARDKGASELSRESFMALFPPGNLCSDRLFRVVDKDKSGAVSYKEICEAVMTNRTMDTLDSKLQVLFKFYDKDGDGKLSKFEVADAMLLASNSDMTPRAQINQLVQTIFSSFDEDRDAHLSFLEFSNVMKATGLEFTQPCPCS